MEQKEFTIESSKELFRIRKINAIELLALQSQISFDSFEDSKQLYETILEKIEVKCGEQWLKVKDGSNYYPKGIEDNLAAIQELIKYYLYEFVKPVFQKSNGLNNTQE